jgi:hypothetical protein
MPTAYTSLLGLALPVQGEETGQWGNLVNTAITSLLDTAVAGTTTLSTDGNVTLTSSTGIADQARAAIIVLSGARTAIRTVTAPARSKVYVVINQTTGGFDAQFVGVGPTTGVTIANGNLAVVAWNGTDFQTLVTNLATQVTGVLPLANGGTSGTTAATARTGIGATTVGSNMFTLTNPSAVTFPRFNADNTVSSLDAATFRTAIGASSTTGTVTSVAATVPAFLSVAGSPITSTGTLAVSFSGTALPVANGGTGITSFGSGVATFLGTPSSANLAAAVTDETGSGALVFATSPSLTTPTLTGYTETVFAITDGASVDINPANGTIQTWTLGANRTPTATSFANGQSVTLMIADGAAYTITWSSLAVTWETNGGTAPTLATSGFTPIVLWKVAGTIYGARVGDA